MILSTVLLLALACPLPTQAAPSLGGLSCYDSLGAIHKALGLPNMVRAHRAADPSADFAVFIYPTPALTMVTLTPYGDKLTTVLTESPALTTNDGIRVGDPVSTVTAKLGKPEETGHEMPGITEYWYWSRGINFGIDDSKQTVANVFLFPAGKPQSQGQGQEQPQGEMQHILLPSKNLDVQHRYLTSGGKTYIAGTVRNKASGPLYNVHLGLELMDKNGHTMQTVPVDAGSIVKGDSIPFKVEVPPKGTWASYRVVIQAPVSPSAKSVKYALMR